MYLDGHSELLFKNRISDIIKIQMTNKFEISFRTTSQTGLLIYTGTGNLDSYLIVGLLDGKLVYSFTLPTQKQTFWVSSSERVNDNQWHTLSVERNRRKATLTIDHSAKYNATFDEINYVGFGNLATDGYVRLGGYRKLPFGMRPAFYHGFKGCIGEFKLDDRLIDLAANNLNLRYYPSVCDLSSNS